MKQQAKKEASEFEKEIKDISHLLEKIKLSTYAKKGGKHNEENVHNHYQSEINQAAETKVTK